MGWGTGSEIMSRIIKASKKTSAKARRDFYGVLIDTFEEFDCDTLEECRGEDGVFDEVFRAKHPDWYEEG